MSQPAAEQRDLLLTVTNTADPYGPIQANLHFDIKTGYTALFGANNAGKSALLQLIFRVLMGQEGFGPDGICLILPDRQPLSASNETAGRVLAAYNNELHGQLSAQPLSYETAQPNRNDLGRLLLHHNDMLTQIEELRRILVTLGLPRVDLGEQQVLYFDRVQGFFQGSGLRALYPIVAALTDPRLRVILIDEPELSLEPTLQKALRDLLVERATDRAIIVASHSHLFVDRSDLGASHIVRRVDGNVEAEQITTERQLLDLVFKLLGNSTEDLFFPGNYAVVEGGCDQTLVERTLLLLGAEPGQVKVVSASGITSVRGMVFAVKQALLPLVFGDSPYQDRVVALIDQPTTDQQVHAIELREELDERLIELPAPSLEEYLPEEVYAAAGLDREAQLERVRAAATRAEKERIKSEIATTIADALSVDLLDRLPEIKQIAELALVRSFRAD